MEKSLEEDLKKLAQQAHDIMIKYGSSLTLLSDITLKTARVIFYPNERWSYPRELVHKIK